MPELPEVETVRRAIEKLLLDVSVQQYQLLFSQYLRTGHELIRDVPGGLIEQVERRGKILAIHLSHQISLIHHLGMSGRLLCCSAQDPLAKHTHVVITLEDSKQNESTSRDHVSELRQFDPRRFGYCGIVKTCELIHFEPWAKMGPDPFQLKPKAFQQILSNRKRPIKALLLEQHLIGGMGNIYVDESLFRAKIHPLRLAQDITQEESRALLKYMRQVLSESIAAGGSSTSDYQKLDGTLGEFQHKHRVYRREGQNCVKCKNLIQKIELAGRGTHFCPNCQSI